MIVMLLLNVSAWWIWYIFFAAWTIIEYKIAKNVPLKWWHWLFIVLIIIMINWGVLELVEYFKHK